MKPSTLRSILRFVIHSLTRPETGGLENLPAEGAFILATNHMSRVDVPLLFTETPRADLIALVADSYKKVPLFAFVVETNGSIWIDRDKADFAAMRKAMEHIRSGGILGIAPEGTRSKVGALLPAKTGVALLAEKARVPVVPVAIIGTENAVRLALTLRRPRLKVCYGKPFLLPPVDRDDREASLQRNTDEIMCRIAAMMPPRYHGYYANHPRLKAILQQGEQEVPDR